MDIIETKMADYDIFCTLMKSMFAKSNFLIKFVFKVIFVFQYLVLLLFELFVKIFINIS